MRSQYVGILVDLLESEGINTSRLLSDARISTQQLRTGNEISAKQFTLFCEYALTHSQNPTLGLAFGAAINMNTHGALGYALMSSANLGQVMELLLQYYRVVLPDLHLSINHFSTQLSLSCFALQMPTNLERFFVETFFAALVTAGRFLTQGKIIATQLEFDYPRPSEGLVGYDFFPFPVLFDRPQTQMLVPIEHMKVQLATANPSVTSIFREQCERMLPQQGKDAALSSRVQHLLLAHGGEFPTINYVAQQLFISERSLRRKLRAEGTTFQTLLDQVRFNLSKEYLTNTQLPISEVARLIGFSDTTNFRRSFKRWSNTTPSEWRTEIKTESTT